MYGRIIVNMCSKPKDVRVDAWEDYTVVNKCIKPKDVRVDVWEDIHSKQVYQAKRCEGGCMGGL